MHHYFKDLITDNPVQSERNVQMLFQNVSVTSGASLFHDNIFYILLH